MDHETLPLLHDYEDDDKPYTPTVLDDIGGETSSTTNDVRVTRGDKIIPLSNELKPDIIQALYNFLALNENVNLAELDRIRLN